MLGTPKTLAGPKRKPLLGAAFSHFGPATVPTKNLSGTGYSPYWARLSAFLVPLTTI
jgi:hypothetical protein